ncbi:MAG: hypothetical protein GY769_13110 [bacterium]|nr:hypothetical protein [bacterium]
MRFSRGGASSLGIVLRGIAWALVLDLLDRAVKSGLQAAHSTPPPVIAEM